MDQQERELQRRWDLMKQVLGAEARGDELRGFSSGRTLFGIKSHTEEVIERVAAEESARCLKLARERAQVGEPAGDDVDEGSSASC